MSIKGAIFDLDGTLLDTEPIYDEAAQKVINEFGNGKKIEWEVKKNVIGTSAKVHSKIFVDSYEIKLTPEEFKKKRDQLLIEPFKKCKFTTFYKKIDYSYVKAKVETGLSEAMLKKLLNNHQKLTRKQTSKKLETEKKQSLILIGYEKRKCEIKRRK